MLTTTKMYIYHIVMPQDWDKWREISFYEPSSLVEEGFIHCSFYEQLDGVIQRYYAEAGEIVVLKIETGRLVSKLVAEQSTGDEMYPHVYGPINRDAIVEVELRHNSQMSDSTVDG